MSTEIAATETNAVVKAVSTPEQAKIDAVAHLTMKAYERAGTLELTDQERKALTADFPDSDFQPGAAGKENLIYIEHPALRDRLNSVIGAGQWALVPRSRWTEQFQTKKGYKGVRVYVEAMLIIRGCFVGEAIGDMDYYANDATNFGDAVEGAKTAALRRCAKELGIGLQAWKKSWCESWWQRKRKPQQTPPSDEPQTLQDAMEQDSNEPKSHPNRPRAEKCAAEWVERFNNCVSTAHYNRLFNHEKLGPNKEQMASDGFQDLIEQIDNAARECEDRVHKTEPVAV